MQPPRAPQPDDVPGPDGREPAAWSRDLHRATLRIVQAGHGASFLDDVAREVGLLFPAARVLVSVLDRQDGQLHLAAHHAVGAAALASSVAVGEGLVGRVFERGLGERVADYGAWAHRVSDVKVDEIGSAMAAPLVGGDGAVHGVVGVAAAPGMRSFDEEDLATLEAITAVVAAALEAREARAGLAAEVAERLAATARERAVRQGRTEFMSRISHELRTPLNAVSGFAQLLQITLGEGPQASQVEHLLQATQHLRRLVDDVTDISVIEGGRLTLELSPVRLGDVLDPIAPMMRAEAERNGRRFELEVRLPIGTLVRADAARARQVLLNLGSNAVKYNRSGGLVRVVAQMRDGRVAISVQDTGVGIAESDLERVFQPFVRLPAAVGSAPGSGLGLALARNLAEAMGATIEVVSRPGIGSTFTLLLAHADPLAVGPGSGERGRVEREPV
jgi:signal transduction histidine kinase